MSKLLSMTASGFLLFCAAIAQAEELGHYSATAEGDNDISELSGELVPVGDQNRYRLSYPRFNISTNPMGMIVGSYGVSVSYSLGRNVALRADLNYFNEFDSSKEGFEVGAGVPIYFRKVYSGLFLEPGVMVRRSTIDLESLGEEETQRSGSATRVGPQVLVGYHWIWDSGLNIAVAAGVGRNFNAEDDAPFDNDEELFANGYLRIGYAF